MTASDRDHRPEPYFTLNALRGVAAIGVLLLHASDELGLHLIDHGYLAVDLFFLMSGFVIAHAYDRRLAGGTMGFGGFIKARLIRFYPLYLIGLCAGLLRVGLQIANGSASFSLVEPLVALAFALLFLPAPPSAFGGDKLYPLNLPSWSLGVELLVNGIFAAFHRRFSSAVLAATVAIAGALLIATCLAGLIWNIGPLWHHGWGGMLRASFSFPLGVLIYRHRDRIPALPLPAMIGPLLLAICLVAPTSALGAGYDLLFTTVLAPAIVVISIAQPAPLWRPLCTWLGRTSYPLYAIHWPLLFIAAGAARAIGVSPDLLIGGTIAGLLACCWYLDVIDEQFRRSLGARRAELAAP
jgi:peptidoglycan/LPS O-acetylase OafA/YrhL